MNPFTALKNWAIKEYRHSPIGFWVWILLCIAAIGAYAYLKTGGH